MFSAMARGVKSKNDSLTFYQQRQEVIARTYVKAFGGRVTGTSLSSNADTISVTVASPRGSRLMIGIPPALSPSQIATVVIDGKQSVDTLKSGYLDLAIPPGAQSVQVRLGRVRQ